MRRLLRPFALVAVLGSAVVLAGCGGGTTVTNESLTFEQLSEAATSSADATSGRFAFSFEMTVPDLEKPFAFAGEGAFDANADRAHLSFDFSSFAELLGGMFSGFGGSGSQAPDFGDPKAWQIEAVKDGEDVYMRFPAIASQLPAGKSWVKTNAQDAGTGTSFNFSQLQDMSSNDPRKMLEFLRAASGGIENVGREELRGVSTTHYRATVDLREYEKLVPPDKREELRSMMSEALEQTGLTELPVDVWLDDNGLVRQVEMSVSGRQPGTDETLDGTIRFELWDYGKVVDIDLPPAAEVVDASAID
jgi:hypothetical protein